MTANDNAKLAAKVAAAFSAGKTLSETTKLSKVSVHRVAPLFWAEVAKSLGSIDPDAKSVKAARRAGNRREVVAYRAGISVAQVTKLETSSGARPVYTGKGTKVHLTVA
jgi:hypothetical protein